VVEVALPLLAIVAVGVGLLIWRSFLPSYTSEKGKNLATSEDIAAIARKVEEVKTVYTERLKKLEHQNSLVLEQLRAQQQLRLAAAERRLNAHQEAFSLWRKILAAAHSESIHPLVIECQGWWDKNCLFLSAEARDSFNRAYFAAASHRQLTLNRTDAALVKENWAIIIKAGEDIVAGAELPSLGTRETQWAAS